MATNPIPHISLDEFLAMQETADLKYEYHQGTVYAMPGGTFIHSALSNRIGALLDAVFPDCTVLSSDMFIWIDDHGIGVYPDTSVICGPPQFRDQGQRALLNPSLIVEVFSSSSEHYDRTTKRYFYQGLPSVQDILLIAQDERRVECWSRKGDGWSGVVYLPGANVIPLHRGQLSFPAIYHRILPEAPALH